MDDSKIIELFFERSEQAIIELSNKYGAIFSKVADNILNNRRDAEECVNDAYLGVWNTIPPQRPDPLLSYVCRIVRNLALKKYHENTAQKRNSYYDAALDEIEDCIPSSFSVENQIMAKEVAGVIDGFLETLDQQSRIMFIRRYWHADLYDIWKIAVHPFRTGSFYPHMPTVKSAPNMKYQRIAAPLQHTVCPVIEHTGSHSHIVSKPF
ncbi:MAG: sigma-70 family RNA polymerase sigma factor [Clostridia bacterium]|nr:sigma-70 family RNA polymerase sigma factor [Clostridia bacterium]